MYSYLDVKISQLVSVYMFDYVSTVISYSLIGVAIFLGKYNSLTPADLASVISKVREFVYYDFVRKLYWVYFLV